MGDPGNDQWLNHTVAEDEQQCLPYFTQSQSNTLRAVALLGSSLSFVGGMFILGTFAWFPQVRSFPFKLVALLSLSNVGSSVGYFFNFGSGASSQDLARGSADLLAQGGVCNQSVSCKVAAVLTQYFDVASFLWIGIIAYTIRQVLVHERGRAVEHQLSKFQVFCWGLPAITVIVIFVFGEFGDAGWNCWVSRKYQGLRFFCYYFPLLLVLIYTSYNYCSVGSAVSNLSQRALVNYRLRFYIGVFIFMRIWGVANRVMDVFTGEPIFALVSVLLGFKNCVIFVV